eukprot:33613-Eustigmatos_ZCMA.PRE.1
MAAADKSITQHFLPSVKDKSKGVDTGLDKGADAETEEMEDVEKLKAELKYLRGLVRKYEFKLECVGYVVDQEYNDNWPGE